MLRVVLQVFALSATLVTWVEYVQEFYGYVTIELEIDKENNGI